ncbi:hypothetical protein TNCV_254121 [Trichonephila clavipes]|nr:hypothetical protein TNCV_254121 [Trichonephila clavipes]
MVGNAKLTYWKNLAVMNQAGVILNLCSICPLSNVPDDCEVLTPSHFLIGRFLNVIPEPSSGSQIFTNVWRRILVGIKEDNVPTCKWSLRRITEVIPGSDGHVRVVKVKIRDKILKNVFYQ